MRQLILCLVTLRVFYVNTQVEDVRREPMGSDELPADSGSGTPTPVPDSVSSLIPDHSCSRSRYSDTAVVSRAVSDDGSVNLLRTTGYGSYPIVSCQVTKTRNDLF